MSVLEEKDLHWLRHSFALALESRAQGRHPFAAVVIGPDGQIVVECFNDSRLPQGDPTRHAERVAAAQAARRLSASELAQSTLYTNAEPCAMCAGAIYWCGIGRVVYGMSEVNLLGVTGSDPENPTLSLPCREVFTRGQRPIEVFGPLLEDEAAVAHEGFWTPG
jgi:tRNA(Arg) A34 adenosine deaminase TadA